MDKDCYGHIRHQKMILVESMPEADSIIVIWFKLLCMADFPNKKNKKQLTLRDV